MEDSLTWLKMILPHSFVQTVMCIIQTKLMLNQRTIFFLRLGRLGYCKTELLTLSGFIHSIKIIKLTFIQNQTHTQDQLRLEVMASIGILKKE